MSAENIEIVERIQAILPADNVVGAFSDQKRADELRDQLAGLVEPDFRCEFVSPPEYGGSISGRGVDGFRDAWADWTEAFSTYRIEVTRMLDAGDRVVSLVTQGGVTRTGGVEISTDAAAVWTLRDGRLAKVEFYLDAEAALREAGIDPSGAED